MNNDNQKMGCAYHVIGFINAMIVFSVIAMILAMFRFMKPEKPAYLSDEKTISISDATMYAIDMTEENLEGFSSYQYEAEEAQLYYLEYNVYNYGNEAVADYYIEYPSVRDEEGNYLDFKIDNYYGGIDEIYRPHLAVCPPGETYTVRVRVLLRGELPETIRLYRDYQSESKDEYMTIYVP